MNNTIGNAVASLIMITLAMYLALVGKPTEMGLIIIAGSISIAFLNIDRIQKFKGAGFEAEMKQAVKDAHATVEQLRTLAAASTEGTLTTLMAGNFMSGITLAARLDLHDRLITSLNEIGVSKAKIDEANQLWNKGVGVVYHRGIRNSLGNLIAEKTKIDPNLRDSFKEVIPQFDSLLRFEKWEAPSSSAMKTSIESHGLMSPEIEELLLDYSHFEKHGTYRRREVFVSL